MFRQRPCDDTWKYWQNKPLDFFSFPGLCTALTIEEQRSVENNAVPDVTPFTPKKRVQQCVEQEIISNKKSIIC